MGFLSTGALSCLELLCRSSIVLLRMLTSPFFLLKFHSKMPFLEAVPNERLDQSSDAAGLKGWGETVYS